MTSEMRKVLLINWDSYPHVSSGGVATWAKGLVENMQDHEFIIFNQLSNPNANANFRVPQNVKKVIGVPVFGTTRLDEYLQHEDSMIGRIERTTESVVRKRFLPLYEDLLDEILGDNGDPEVVRKLILETRGILTQFDPKKCLEHPETWETVPGPVEARPPLSGDEAQGSADQLPTSPEVHPGPLGPPAQGRRGAQLPGVAPVHARRRRKVRERRHHDTHRTRGGVPGAPPALQHLPAQRDFEALLDILHDEHSPHDLRCRGPGGASLQGQPRSGRRCWGPTHRRSA